MSADYLFNEILIPIDKPGDFVHNHRTAICDPPQGYDPDMFDGGGADIIPAKPLLTETEQRYVKRALARGIESRVVCALADSALQRAACAFGESIVSLMGGSLRGTVAQRPVYNGDGSVSVTFCGADLSAKITVDALTGAGMMVQF